VSPPAAAAAGRDRKGHRQEVAAGDYVFREGELGTEMYIVQEGQVEILKRIGGEERQLAVLEKGDFFGEMSLLE
jgi:CRP-like cAMP-binding protein